MDEEEKKKIKEILKKRDKEIHSLVEVPIQGDGEPPIPPTEPPIPPTEPPIPPTKHKGIPVNKDGKRTGGWKWDGSVSVPEPKLMKKTWHAENLIKDHEVIFNKPIIKKRSKTALILKNNNPEEGRLFVINKIISKKDKLINAQLDEATGLYYETADGKHIYQRKPDTTLGQYLLNQWIGKPKESIEIKTGIILKVDF